MNIHNSTVHLFLLIGTRGRVLIRGAAKIIYGTIAIISADNLGSLALGGFKESCSSLRMCRHCMATKDESQHQVRIYVLCSLCKCCVCGECVCIVCTYMCSASVCVVQCSVVCVCVVRVYV